MSKAHWCHDCKGTGKIVKTERRILHGKEKLFDFRVDCPGLLVDQFDTKRMPIAGQDRAAGETKEQTDD